MEHKTFIAAVAQRAATDTATASRLAEALAHALAGAAAAGTRVAIPGFGTFAGIKHEEEVVTDATDGRRMLMPPSLKLEFAPSSMLRKAMKGGAS